MDSHRHMYPRPGSRAHRALSFPPVVYLAILAAGFVGACLRYLCECIPFPACGGFPVATLFINVVGSFVIFVIFQQVGRRMHLMPQVVQVINAGVLGAFTTLATVCTETIGLVQAGAWGMAAGYVAATFVLTFAATMLAAKFCDGLALLRLRKLHRRRAQQRAVRQGDGEKTPRGETAGAAEAEGPAEAESSDKSESCDADFADDADSAEAGERR